MSSLSGVLIEVSGLAQEEDSAIACTKDELEGYDDDTTDYSSETDDEDEWMEEN